ncbi:MAG: rod shape-determining protein MreD [Bacteroidetes bacterium]|nr:rod shape-determining protein MreD [Bacteroidota bacterium]
MINPVSRNIFRMFVLVLFQVLVLNNIQVCGYINPYMYVLFILLLPFETPRWLLLISGFVIGISIDLFVNTPGMHTSATVFMAFLRPYVLKILRPHDEYKSGSYPRLYYYGFTWFLKYSLVLVFLHHTFLFYVEAFRMTFFFHTMLRVLLSTLFSVFLIVLSQFIIYRKQK